MSTDPSSDTAQPATLPRTSVQFSGQDQLRRPIEKSDSSSAAAAAVTAADDNNDDEGDGSITETVEGGGGGGKRREGETVCLENPTWPLSSRRRQRQLQQQQQRLLRQKRSVRESARDHLVDDSTCAVCLELLVNAVTANPCGHCLCGPCGRTILGRPTLLSTPDPPVAAPLPAMFGGGGDDDDDDDDDDDEGGGGSGSGSSSTFPGGYCPTCRQRVESVTDNPTVDRMVWNCVLLGDFYAEDDVKVYLDRCGRAVSQREIECIFDTESRKRSRGGQDPSVDDDDGYNDGTTSSSRKEKKMAQTCIVDFSQSSSSSSSCADDIQARPPPSATVFDLQQPQIIRIAGGYRQLLMGGTCREDAITID